MTTIYTFPCGTAVIADSPQEAANHLIELLNPELAVRSEEPGDDEFEAAYGQAVQHENTATGNPELLETYGKELELVKATDPKLVWTIVDCDDGLSRLCAGFHFVNAVNYLITKTPWKSEEETYLWG